MFRTLVTQAKLAPDTLILAVVAGGDAATETNGSCQVYEDDGMSNDYSSSASDFSLLEVTQRTASGKATVHIVPGGKLGSNNEQAAYDGAPTERAYQIQYRNDGSAPRAVKINDEITSSWWMRAPCTEVTCTYDAPAVVVNTGRVGTDAAVTVELSF